MTSRAQKWAIIRRFESGELTMPSGRFERVPNSGRRIRCVLCHASGYGYTLPTLGTVSPWQVPCLLDHPTPCRCGLRFHSPGHLSQHVKADRWPYRALDHGPVSS